MPPGQESAKRNVGDHASTDRVLKQRFQLLDQIGIVICERRSDASRATARASQKCAMRGSPRHGSVRMLPGRAYERPRRSNAAQEYNCTA